MLPPSVYWLVKGSGFVFCIGSKVVWFLGWRLFDLTLHGSLGPESGFWHFRVGVGISWLGSGCYWRW